MIVPTIVFIILGIWQLYRQDYLLVALALVAILLSLSWPRLEKRFLKGSGKRQP
jgi:hypothetical protein